MNKIIFKNEINRLYERLYSINEGLSSDESKEFLRGFKEGIKEGFKILKKNIEENRPLNEGFFGNVAKAVGNVAGGAKGLFQQGKKLSSKVWSTVADFVTEVVNKVKTGIQTAASWIADQPEKIKEYLTGVYNQAVLDMQSAWNTLKDKATELATSIQNIFTQVTTSVQGAIAIVKLKMATTEEGAKAWYEKNKQLVITQAQEWQQSGTEWLKKAGASVADVATKVGNGTLTALKVIGMMSAILVFGPVYLLIKGIQQIPDLYKASQTQVEAGIKSLGDYWLKIQQEVQQGYAEIKQDVQRDYAKGWNTGMTATGVSTGKVPVRNPTTGRMEAAPAVESIILKFSDFINERNNRSKN